MIGLSAIGRIGLQSLRSAARGVRWDELFSGFPGVAYDKTRVESLTQDRGGLTAVSAAAQSIGLAHDYARASGGWVSGTEIVSNGGFDTDTVWTKGTGWAISGGLAIKTSGVQSNLTQACLTLNRMYVVTGTVSARTAGSLNVYLGSGFAFASFSANGQFSVVGACVGSTSLILQATTSFDGAIDNVSVREITGNPLLAPTDARRPTWGAMANGLPCSVWDGTRAMATAAPVDFSSTDQITVMAAVRKTSDSGVNMIIETGASVASVSGGFSITVPGTPGWESVSRGSSTVFAGSYSGRPSPDSAILILRGKISTDTLTLTRNGTQIATSASDQGAGNYGNHTLNIGARNAASPSLFFNGQIARIAAIGGDIGAEREAAMLGLLAAGFAPS